MATVAKKPSKLAASKATALDVAGYILKKQGEMTVMKLQKLVYYSQAWSLVWDERPLFKERIEAWMNGPVVRSLYARHRGMFKVSPAWKDLKDADITRLDKDARETIDGVLSFYGDKTAQWLSDLTHKESPWVQARHGLADTDAGEQAIDHASMAEYYSSLRD